MKTLRKMLKESTNNKSKMIVVKNKLELRQLIFDRCEEFGNDCDLNDIDVSHITDMSWLFRGSPFNGDMSKWDVSNVTSMYCMFYDSKFNGDISNWDVSNVQDMTNMFTNSNFNGDISNWDVSNVQDMTNMFWNSKYTRNLSKWKDKLPKAIASYHTGRRRIFE